MKSLVTAFKKKLGKSHNRLFIFPTAYGIYFIIIIFVLFLISLSYGHSLAFTTTFIFVSLVFVSAHFTNFNLAGVEVLTVRSEADKHEGEAMTFRVTLKNNTRKDRFDIGASLLYGDECEEVTLAPGETKAVLVSKSRLSRGHYHGERLKLYSLFPFGLFRVWKFWRTSFDFFIYPKVDNSIQLEAPTYPSYERGRSFNKVELGAEEFFGHFAYQEGMPLRSIDWRAYSRGRGILLKKFIEQSDGLYLFDLKEVKGTREEKIRRLAGMIEQAEARGGTYALILEDEAPLFGRGGAFKRNSLKRLALFDKPKREIIL